MCWADYFHGKSSAGCKQQGSPFWPKLFFPAFSRNLIHFQNRDVGARPLSSHPTHTRSITSPFLLPCTSAKKAYLQHNPNTPAPERKYFLQLETRHRTNSERSLVCMSFGNPDVHQLRCLHCRRMWNTIKDNFSEFWTNGGDVSGPIFQIQAQFPNTFEKKILS